MVLLEIMQLLHDLGIAWGVGGATIASIIMIKSGKNPEIAPLARKIMPSISKLMLLGLAFLGISGISLIFLISWPINPLILGIKHVIVIVLVINSIILGILNSKISSTKPSKESFKTMKKVKVSGMINLIFWYLITILSVIM